MPDIILVVYLRTFFIHEAADGHMSVHGIRGSDLGNLDHTERHHFTTAIAHKCVSAILGTVSRAVTMPITI